MKKRSLALALLSLFAFGSLGALAAVSGEQLWVKRYSGTGNNSPSSLAVDSAGNVYVLGSSYAGQATDYDFMLIKYNAAGTQKWKRSYNGPGSKEDSAEAIAIDSKDNIYVSGTTYSKATGNDFKLIKYDPNGNILWQRSYNSTGINNETLSGMALDSEGNVYLTGSSTTNNNDLYADYDSIFVTIKYNLTGTRKWIKKYTPTNKYSFGGPVAIAVDPKGNIIVTGSSENGIFENLVTLKYDTLGSIKWVRTYKAKYGYRDRPRALAVDIAGNSYIVGTSDDYNDQHIITIKYNRTGTRKWIKRSTEPRAYPYGIAVDDDGNSYIAGMSSNNMMTIKYDTNGDRKWTRNYNGPGNWQDGAEAIALLDGNIYVTGFSFSKSNWDLTTIKYSPTGIRRWLKTYNGPADDFDAGVAITTGNDAVYVLGESDRYRHSTDWDFVTIKYHK